MRRLTRGMAYLWAAPTTSMGLAAGAVTLITGGRVRRRGGTLEFHGGIARWGFDSTGFRAMTLGHVILGRDECCLELCHDHERAHVRQAERWGPLFVPAYLLSSVWELARGRRCYRDNWFERDARLACGEEV